MAENVSIPEELQYKADGVREKLNQDFPTREIMAAEVAEGLEQDLDAVRVDTFTAQTKLTTIETTLSSTVLPQLASLIPTVAGLTAAVAALGLAVQKAQAAADRAQATADSKPGGEGSGGYAVILAWTSSLSLPDQYISISSLGKSISQRIPANTEIKLAGLTSGSVVTFGVDIGDDKTVQWKNKTTGTNLSGRSSFYRTFSGFTVPATTGTGSFVADIG